MECRLASLLLLNKLNKSKYSLINSLNLKHVIDIAFGSGVNFDDALAAVDQHLHDEPYSWSECAHILGTTTEQLISLITVPYVCIEPDTKFLKLKTRAR